MSGTECTETATEDKVGQCSAVTGDITVTWTAFSAGSNPTSATMDIKVCVA